MTGIKTWKERVASDEQYWGVSPSGRDHAKDEEIAELRAKLAALEGQEPLVEQFQDKDKDGWRRECEATDRMLARAGFNPNDFRSEGGNLLCHRLVDAIDARVEAAQQAAAGAREAQPAESAAARHWHDLYVKVCGKSKDDAARFGAEIVALELALAQPAQPMTIDAVNDAWAAASHHHRDEMDVFALVRAVEANYGIKGARE